MQANEISRRKFLKVATVFAAGAVFSPKNAFAKRMMTQDDTAFIALLPKEAQPALYEFQRLFVKEKAAFAKDANVAQCAREPLASVYAMFAKVNFREMDFGAFNEADKNSAVAREYFGAVIAAIDGMKVEPEHGGAARNLALTDFQINSEKIRVVMLEDGSSMKASEGQIFMLREIRKISSGIKHYIS